MLTFLKSERAIDYLRWGVAFVTVVLAYGIAGWMLLRPTGWERGVNAPVVEIDLTDSAQLAAVPPAHRETGRSDETKAPGMDAPGALPRPAGDQQDVVPESRSGGAATNKNEVATSKDAGDGAADAAAKANADEAANTQPGTPAEKASETPPRTDATDSGGAGRPIATPPPITTPPRIVMPDNSNPASIMHAPIDTSITVNQGKGLLRSAKGGPQFRGAQQVPQLRLAPLLATPKGRNDIFSFSRKPNPVAGSTLPLPGPTAAANHSHTQDLAQKPVMGADGRLVRNAIGVVIEQRTVVPQAGSPLGVHLLPGASATRASGEHGPATTATGAPLAAGTPKPGDASRSAGAANHGQASHPDQASVASHIASVGGPAIGGTPMIRPASSIAAVGGSAKAVAGVISGANVRMRHP